MPIFAIEREMPGAGDLSPDQLRSISQKSWGVIAGIGPQFQWVQSFVTPDRI